MVEQTLATSGTTVLWDFLDPPNHLSIVIIYASSELPATRVSLSVSNGSVTEGGTLTVTATLDSDNTSGAAISVPIRVRPSGTTAQPGDYEIATSISIPDNARVGTTSFTAIDDDAEEPDETVLVEIGDVPEGVSVGAPSHVEISIADNDQSSAIDISSIADKTGTVDELLEVRLSVSGDDGIDNLQYSASSSDERIATVSPTDLQPYSSTSQITVTPKGEGTATITVTVTDGTTVATEEFSITVAPAADPPGGNELTYRLCAKDNEVEDQDRVNIRVNGRLVFSNLELKTSEECKDITLERNPSRNTIRVQALNLGDQGYNTAALLIRPATPSSMETLARDNWDLKSTGEEQVWAVYAISEDEVRLTAIAADQAQKSAIQGTVAGVAAATVSNVTSNIGARFSAPSGGTSVSLAGTPVALGSAQASQSAWPHVGDRLDAFGEEPGRSWQRTMSGSELLRSSSFEIALGAAEGNNGNSLNAGGAFTFWGRGDFQIFESGGGRRAGYDGDLVAGYLGADFTTEGGWLIGLAVSRIAAEADYTLGSAGGGGNLEADLTNLHPYVRFALDDRTEAWTILGLGKGEVKDTSRDGSKSESNLSMGMMAAGARHLLNTDMGIDLALLGDGSLATVETDEGVQSVDGISANVWRARIGVEASYTTVWEGGSSLTSFVEVAARQDGGDSAEGTGLEVSPGVAFNDPESGLSVEARGRALALHSADNHREYGASITARVAPGADGLGLAMAMTPTWGTPNNSLGSMDASLFPRDVADSRSDSLSLNSRVSYGFAAGGGVLAPFAELALHHDDNRRLRIGSRYSLGPAVDLELFGGRSGDGSGSSEHSAGFNGRIRF